MGSKKLFYHKVVMTTLTCLKVINGIPLIICASGALKGKGLINSVAVSTFLISQIRF